MANPYSARLKRDPVGLALLVGLPVVMLAAMGVGKAALVTPGALIVGWLTVGMVPTALGAQRDPVVETRWRALPVGAADRFFLPFFGLVPACLASGAALTAVAYFLGAAALRTPNLFGVGLLTTLVMAAVGLAVAAWTSKRWQAAAVVVVFAIAALWSINAPWQELFPTGQAQRALTALARPRGDLADPLIKLGLMGLVWAGIALAGFGRRSIR